MAANPSFDIVSKVDRQEVDNALRQAEKELGTRFDFRGTGAQISWSGEEAISLQAETEERVRAALEVFKEKLIKRNISLKSLDAGDPRPSGKVFKIGIFMSVLNAHVNRSPVAGSVSMLRHEPGKFYNALRSKAGKENESNIVELSCPDVPGGRVVVKQIAGVLARRIVCGCKLGDELARGQRFGMIKFGSRTELYLHYCEELRVQVRQGQKVKAGSSVLLCYGLEQTGTSP